MIKPTWLQEVIIKVRGRVLTRHEKLEDYYGYVDIYMCYCKKHGYYETYPRSHWGWIECPECLKEELKRFERRGEKNKRSKKMQGKKPRRNKM